MSDYISIHEALEKINDLAREAFRLDDGYGFYFGALHDVADVLRKMPTIDAVPVVHGEWIVKGQDVFCSVCGEESAYTWHGASKFSNYCPNCGAKMDGGKDDATND